MIKKYATVIVEEGSARIGFKEVKVSRIKHVWDRFNRLILRRISNMYLDVIIEGEYMVMTWWGFFPVSLEEKDIIFEENNPASFQINI